jgi:hypothetical protein
MNRWQTSLCVVFVVCAGNMMANLKNKVLGLVNETGVQVPVQYSRSTSYCMYLVGAAHLFPTAVWNSLKCTVRIEEESSGFICLLLLCIWLSETLIGNRLFSFMNLVLKGTLILFCHLFENTSVCPCPFRVNAWAR